MSCVLICNQQCAWNCFAASIGKLRIIVPWKKLGWEPILISLEDVTICAGPREESEVC